MFHAIFHGGQNVVVKVWINHHCHFHSHDHLVIIIVITHDAKTKARTLDLETEAHGSVHYNDEATGAEVFFCFAEVWTF